MTMKKNKGDKKMMLEDVFNTACNLYYNWQNGNGTSQSEVMCFCWDNNLDYDEVEDFVDEYAEAYQKTEKNWNEFFTKKG